MTRRPTFSLLITFSVMVALAGCVTVVTPPNNVRETPRAEATQRAEPGTQCVAFAQPGLQRFDDCDELVAEGVDLDIEARSVQTLIVRGDRNDIDVVSVGSLSISGHDNEVDIDGDVGSLTIAGDRNEVEAEGEIGSVTIDGNDNEVHASLFGPLADNGDRNRVNR